jgi:hypothetical protein
MGHPLSDLKFPIATGQWDAGNLEAMVNERYAGNHGNTRAIDYGHFNSKNQLVGPLQHGWVVCLGFVLVEERTGNGDGKRPLLGDSGSNSLFGN